MHASKQAKQSKAGWLIKLRVSKLARTHGLARYLASELDRILAPAGRPAAAAPLRLVRNSTERGELKGEGVHPNRNK